MAATAQGGEGKLSPSTRAAEACLERFARDLGYRNTAPPCFPAQRLGKGLWEGNCCALHTRILASTAGDGKQASNE